MKQVDSSPVTFKYISVFISSSFHSFLGKLPIVVDMNALPDDQLLSHRDDLLGPEETPPPIPPRLI